MDQSKLVINDIPDKIKNILHEIYECIRDGRAYTEIYKQTVIDWLIKNHGDYLLYEYWDHIAVVISEKDCFITDAKEGLEDRYNKKLNEIPEDELCDFFRYLVSEAGEDTLRVLGITSVGFKFNEKNMVLAFGVKPNFYDVPELFWLDFFLNDSDVLKFVEENENWINCDKKFTNQQILQMLR